MIEKIEHMISERNVMLRNGEISKAKSIEAELNRFNVTLEDTRHGTRYFIG